jgi:hypothetical protein
MTRFNKCRKVYKKWNTLLGKLFNVCIIWSGGACTELKVYAFLPGDAGADIEVEASIGVEGEVQLATTIGDIEQSMYCYIIVVISWAV